MKYIREMKPEESKTLRRIWERQILSMSIPDSRIHALEVLIGKVFNPAKKRSTLLKIAREMPYAKDFSENDIEILESYGYVVTVPTTLGKRVTVTPEGLISLEQHEKGISDFNLKEMVYQSYRKYCFHKIERLKKKEELKPKHIGVLLFFLLNGSIGQNKSYKVRSYEDLSYLEGIVRSYISDSYEVRDNYALKYYLVEAKRILGDIAVNKKPNYYLREETLGYVLESIGKEVKRDKSFHKRWERLKNAYRENGTLLRMRGNSYYTTSWEMELDRLFGKK